VPDKDWTARSLVAAIRAEAKLAQALGGDWRTVVDGLRPHTADLWAALPEAERARLARHALRYWDVHRHRMAPEIAARITALQQRGRLVIAAGKVTAIDPRSAGCLGGGGGLRGVQAPLRTCHRLPVPSPS